MINRSTLNFHVEYLDVTQHWCPLSEKYAGGDALLTAVDEGWNMGSRVICEEHWFAGMRLTRVFHIELHRNGERRIMPVLHNPYVDRMLASDDFQIVVGSPADS
jgi:hypothetical protein